LGFPLSCQASKPKEASLFCFVSYHLSTIGGTSVDQGAADGGTNQQPNRNIPAAKWQRVVGQALMLIVNIFLSYCVVETI
jgi:hypothetical protein